LQPPSIASSTIALGSEVRGIHGKARARAVLDPLVDRQDAHVPCPAEPAVAEDLLEVPQRRVRAIGLRDDAIDEVWAR